MQTLSELRIALQQKIFNHSYCKTFNSYSQAVLQKLSACHTAKIGLHVYQCNSCKKEHMQYHSCNNRHCPNCGGLKREQWILDRHSELLPTPYFHVVFTLPAQLRSLCMGNRKVMFDLLFTASSHTIQKLCSQEKHLGATPGIVTVLHTNGQDLNFHPHVHCIVTGGGVLARTHLQTTITDDGEYVGKKITTHTWINAKRKSGTYFLPRSLLAENFRNKYLQELVNLYDAGKLKTTNAELQNVLDAVQQLHWNVYAKASFGGPAQVIEYLARYTHKVAITAHRIVSITDTDICFNYKDYADGYKQKQMTLSIQEFLRRFEQHILPVKLVKIRHSGFLSPAYKNARLATIYQQLALSPRTPKIKLPVNLLATITYGIDIMQCKNCNVGKMQLIATYIYFNFGLVDVKDFKTRGSPTSKST